jgi:hypothetical protein
MRLMTGKRAETLLELMYQIEYFTLARAWEGLTDAVPGAAGDLGRGHPGVQPQGDGGVP